jgi:hypothetical protein
MTGHALDWAWPFYLPSQLEQKKGRAQLRARPFEFSRQAAGHIRGAGCYLRFFLGAQAQKLQHNAKGAR